jgi:putative ABC transport system permease protein
MLFKIAWRNLNRNKRRTLIIMSSAAIGVFCMFLYDAISRGMMNQMLSNQLETNISHIQINKNGFNDDKILKTIIPEPERIETVLGNSPFIKHYSKRAISFGMLSSANNTISISLMGIEHDKESSVTLISKYVEKGAYLSGKSNEMILSRKLAEKLEVSLGDKVVATAADIGGEVSTELFRVSGIFRSPATDVDQLFVFVNLTDLQKMLGLGSSIHQFAIITNDETKVAIYKKDLFDKIKDERYEILSYRDIIPLMVSMLESSKSAMVIIYAIIAFGVLLGVINSMLMSVFERVQEFGVLMSIGMKSGMIFKMITLEAFLLGVIGTLFGIIMAFIVYIPLSINGLDLSSFSEGLQMYNVGNVIYPEIDLSLLLNSFLVMPIASMLGAVYPSMKAIKLQPSDAMRYV